MDELLEKERWISQTSLLWRTRGRLWDHAFLMLPTVQPKVGWYKAYQAIIALCPESKEQKELYDCVFNVAGEDGNDIYVSVGTIYDHRVDISGRNIRHTFFYVLPEDTSEEKTVPSEWVKTLWKLVNTEFSIPYQSTTEPNLGTGNLNKGFGVPLLPSITMSIVKIRASSDHDGQHLMNKKPSSSFLRVKSKFNYIRIISIIFLLAAGFAITLTILTERSNSILPKDAQDKPVTNSG